jgi:hypothetical protein
MGFIWVWVLYGYMGMGFIWVYGYGFYMGIWVYGYMGMGFRHTHGPVLTSLMADPSTTAIELHAYSYSYIWHERCKCIYVSNRRC